jgi:hypothetical protein
MVSNQFNAIGKFGIGFFSVFMLGNSVTVTSWRHGDARTEMRTLDFCDGLASTPVLRDPTEAEKKSVIDRGTSVRIRLNSDPYSDTGFIGKKSFAKSSLDTLVKFLVPSADLTIAATEADGTKTIIEPGYLEMQDIEGYLNYLSAIANKVSNWPLDDIRKLGLEFIEVFDETRSWGKLVLTPPIGGVVHSGLGVAISNGIRVCPVNSFLGFTRHDEVITVKRDTPSKVIPYEVLREWGIKQKEMILQLGLENIYQNIFWGLQFGLNIYDDTTIIVIQKQGLSIRTVSVGELKRVLRDTGELKVYTATFGYNNAPLSLDSGYLLITSSINFRDFLLESDAPKINDSVKVIEELCRNQWSSVTTKYESFYNPSTGFLNFPNPHGVHIYQPDTNVN